MESQGNCAFVSLGAVLNRDDSILDLLDSPAGYDYVRDSESGQFNEMTGSSH
jgi:hypothetical protein